MAIEDIKQFEHDIATLYEDVLVLQAEASALGLNAQEISDVRSNVRGLKKVLDWAQGLPLDETILSMVEMTQNQAPMWWMLQIRNRFRVMAVMFERRPPRNLPLARRMEALEHRTFDTKQRCLSIFKALNGPIPLEAQPIALLSPARVIMLIKVKLYPWFVEGPYPTPQQDEGGLIPFHAYRMSRCIYGLTSSLNNLGSESWHRTKISFAQTPDWFEIMLTRQELHLRPEMWQSLLEDARIDILEAVPELDGQIMPLTWTEDRGEGMIVRLPWATS